MTKNKVYKNIYYNPTLFVLDEELNKPIDKIYYTIKELSINEKTGKIKYNVRFLENFDRDYKDKINKVKVFITYKYGNDKNSGYVYKPIYLKGE
jgi:hypothetical protein